MAATKNHDYHLVEPDIWPLIGAFSALALFGGAVMWFHDNPYGPIVGLAGAHELAFDRSIQSIEAHHAPVP